MAPDRGFDLSKYTERARDNLIQLFANIPGRKDVVLQKSLVGPIEQLVPFSKLKEQGVEKPYFLENDNTASTQKTIVYLARAEKPPQAQAIATQIKRLQETSSIDHDFHIFWVPRRTLLADKLLEQAGVLGDVTSSELPLHILSSSPDIFSLELNAAAFSELYLDKDPTCIFASARALMQFQRDYGVFPRVTGKGENAKRLADLLLGMRHELGAGEKSNSIPSRRNMPSQAIERLVIIDRQIDLATPLLTQLTFEGLIDEMYAISHGKVDLDTSIAGSAAQPPSSSSGNQQPAPPVSAKRTVALSPPNDTIYSSLRSSHFTAVAPLLNSTARRLQTSYSDPSARAQMTPAQLRSFIAALPGYQTESAALKLHTNILDDLLARTRSGIFRSALSTQQSLVAGDTSAAAEQIEDLSARGADLSDVLRLCCLLSQVNGGVKQSTFDALRKAVVQGYGYQHILTLDALEKMGLFVPRTGGVMSGFSIPGASSLTSASSSSPSPLHGNSGTSANSSHPQIPSGPPATDFSAARRALHLIVDDVDEEKPTDPSYAYSGYAPLSVRLVQCVMQKSYLQALSRGSSALPAAATSSLHLPSSSTAGANNLGIAWRGYENMLNASVRGPTFDVQQGNGDKSAKARETLLGGGGGGGGTGNAAGEAATGAAAPSSSSADARTTLVFFLGGITYAELAALQLVGRQVGEESGGRKRLVVGSTGVISGREVVGAAVARSEVKRSGSGAEGAGGGDGAAATAAAAAS